MKGQRIDFLTADAARFNALRDEWRSAASGGGLSKAGLRVAAVLPGYVNREYGYAFPTDRDIANDITADEKTAKRGLTALEGKELIERVTKSKRDERGIVIGKLRRIYLTMPTEGTVLPFQPKGQSPKGQAEPKGQKRSTEGTYGCPDIPDRTTPDKNKMGRDESELGVYVPARETVPSVFGGDIEFLDTFDRIVIEMTTGVQIGAGEIERITQQAFDNTTDSNDLFMPIHWPEICVIREGDTAGWFIQRTGALIHRRRAA